MASLLSLQGIDLAIKGLNCRNKNALKYRLVNLVRQAYTEEASVQSLKRIDDDELVRRLWGVQGPCEIIRRRRKNLNCVKTAANADLKRLYLDGKNPEGVLIGPDNVFIVSEEAKNRILEEHGPDLKPGGGMSLSRISDLLGMIETHLLDALASEKDRQAGLADGLIRLQRLVENLSDKVGSNGSQTARKDSGPVIGASGSNGSGHRDDAGEGFSEAGAGFGDAPGGPDALDEADLDAAEVVEEIDALEEAGPETVEVIEEVDAAVEDGEGFSEAGTGLGDAPGGADALDEAELDAAEEVEEIDALDEAELDAAELIDIMDIDGNDPETVDIEVLDREDHRTGPEDSGLQVNSLGRDDFDDVNDIDEKNRLLSEQFEGYLGAMDRYYNQYVLISGKEFLVGADTAGKVERPATRIRLSPFYIGRFPVTNALFEIFVEKTGYKTVAEKQGYGTVYHGRFQKDKDERTGLVTSIWNVSLYCERVEGACWYQPGGPGSNLYGKRAHPVVQVTLDDAVAFAAWTGKRLPSEDEWEAAARTADGRTFPWGRDWKNDACNLEGSSIGGTTEVDRYLVQENDFGVVDTLGNVLEWTWNSANEAEISQSRSGGCIAKGGSWVSGEDVRLTSRFELERDVCSNILGFRCVAY